MPTLHWVGKDKVVNHHQEVPFKTLRHAYRFDAPVDAPDGMHANATGNRIIHGDNLEALKALLPEYEGRIKCIYIDPPYNTGNEGWVYNDNVNDPKLKKWLGQVVGKEGEDLSRHDKWLCMMYPRLKLLHRLLAEDGVIFVSIDDNEMHNLRPVLNEIFGERNRIEHFIWKKSYGGGAKERFAITVHEYVLLYAKNLELTDELWLPPDPTSEDRYYKFKDSKVEVRGPYRIKPLEATKSMDRRENLVYGIPGPDGKEIWPKRQWWWSKDRAYAALQNDDLVFTKSKEGGFSISYKQYLYDDEGNQRAAKPFSIIDGIYTQKGTAALISIFDQKLPLQFPKPVELIEKLVQMICLKQKDSIILDSFAGSGTTAHAVLKLNQQDGGNRKFILIETMDYAETITAERVRRVMTGYGAEAKAVAGLGGGFDCYAMGEPLFRPDGNLNEAVGVDEIRRYVAYTEGVPPIERPAEANATGKSGGQLSKGALSRYLLGMAGETAVIFFYEPDRVTKLDTKFLARLKTKPAAAIIYADLCLLDAKFLKQHHLIFKKIPREIRKF